MWTEKFIRGWPLIRRSWWRLLRRFAPRMPGTGPNRRASLRADVKSMDDDSSGPQAS